jgi:hypothetical protein
MYRSDRQGDVLNNVWNVWKDLHTSRGGMLAWRLLFLVIFARESLCQAPSRVAICFFGLMRSLHYTKQSLHAHVFDILDQHGIAYDIYLHTYNMNSLSNARSREYNVSLNKNEWKLLYPSKHVIDDNDEIEWTVVNPLLPQLLDHGDPWKERLPYPSLRNLIKQLYSLKRVTELWRNRTADYQIVLYLRPDVWFFNDLNMTDLTNALTQSSFPSSSSLNSRRFIYVPRFHSWGGVNDRFAFGPPEVMRLYGSRYDKALNYSKAHPLHPETFLRDLLGARNVSTRHTDILFERVRSNGVLWGVPKGEKIPDKAVGRYQLEKNILGQWNAVAVERIPTPRKKRPKRSKSDHKNHKTETQVIISSLPFLLIQFTEEA